MVPMPQVRSYSTMQPVNTVNSSNSKDILKLQGVGSVEIGGHKINLKIGSQAGDIQKQLIAKGCQAEMVNGRLVITTEESILYINDNSGLLQNLWDQNKIGTKESHFVQVVNTQGKPVTIRYTNKSAAAQPTKQGTLSERTKVTLAHRSSITLHNHSNIPTVVNEAYLRLVQAIPPDAPLIAAPEEVHVDAPLPLHADHEYVNLADFILEHPAPAHEGAHVDAPLPLHVDHEHDAPIIAAAEGSPPHTYGLASKIYAAVSNIVHSTVRTMTNWF